MAKTVEDTFSMEENRGRGKLRRGMASRYESATLPLSRGMRNEGGGALDRGLRESLIVVLDPQESLRFLFQEAEESETPSPPFSPCQLPHCVNGNCLPACFLP